MKHKKMNVKWALLLGFVNGMSAFACGSDDGGGTGDGDGDVTGDGDGDGDETGDGDATGDGDGDATGDGDVGGNGGSTGSGDGDGDGEGGETSQSDETLFAVATQTSDENDVYTSYIVVTDSLASGTLSLDHATEIDGRAIVAGVAGSGELYVGTSNNAVVSRYTLSDDGALDKTGEVDFLAAGLSAVNEYAGQFQFVSATKAYYFDGSTGQVVVWNPQAMTYTKSVSLADFVFDGEILTFGAYPIRVGDTLFAFAGWRTNEGQATEPVDRVGIVALDTTDDSVELITDDTCPYVRDGIVADDGYIYLATEAWGSAMHYLNDEVTAPCLLRFDPQALELDESFHVDLTTLLDADAVGSLVVGPDNSAFILALDAQDYEGPPAGRPLASAPLWQWATLNIGDEPTAELLSDSPLTGGSQLPLHFSDGSYLPLLGDESTFVAFESAGPGASGASVAGLAFSTVQLR